MAFIGTPLDTRNTFQSLVGKRFSGDGSTTDFTLDVAPSSTLDIEVFVGNVRQDPNSAYTLSGTTLTFTGAPPSGTNNIYVVHQAKSVGTIGIPDDTISARTLVTADGDNDHILIHDATDGELKKALVPSSTADGFFATSGLSSKDLGTGLHIKTADSSASANAAADELVIEGSANSGISILSGNSSAGRIYFSDSGDDDIGQIRYNHDDNSMNFKVNALADSLKIDSAGHVTHPLTTAFKVTQTSALSVADGHTLFSTNTTEVKDVNADFSGGTFTAPVDGFYYISVSVLYQGIGSGDTDTIEDTFTFSNGNEIIARHGKLNNALSSGGYIESAKATISYMDANDTLTCTHSDGGTLAVHANAHASHFEGFLLG
jgi:hypothetical protein